MALSTAIVPEMKPFMVLAHLFTSSVEKMQIQLDLLKPVVEYERQQTQCGCYLFFQEVHGDPTVITVLESYDGRDYMFGAHRCSPPFQLMKTLESKHETRSKKPLSFFISPSAGFLEKPNPGEMCPAEQVYRITKLGCDTSSRHEVITVVDAYAQTVYNHEGALSCMVAIDTEEPTRLFLFERYTTAAIAKVMDVSTERQQMLQSLNDMGVGIDARDYRAVRGFLSKQEPLV